MGVISNKLEDVYSNKVEKLFAYTCGITMTVNFLICWALPIALMGSIYKYGLKHILLPIFQVLDNFTIIRSFAETYIYTKKEHADFFVTSILLVFNSFCALSVVFYYQFTLGYLPWYIIAAYYFSWVGVGGRIMGAAYALAHKEGHSKYLYKPVIRQYFGNIFENWLGMFFGNVPNNFTTSHVFIHHSLDGGTGDTFYEWDLDRTNLMDFMLYIYRIFLHMIGYSSYIYFKVNNKTSNAQLLLNGIIKYWVGATVLLAITRSPAFVFWIYIQPLMCMTYFLAFLNIGFHGFIEMDENGKSIPSVNATTIIDGEDDYFGEDDHMAHHYNSSVYYKDLKKHQDSKIEEFKKSKSSVFKGLSIVELSIYILLGVWDKLAEHYVDYNGNLSKEEIITMLKTRAKRKETTYDIYQEYLRNPTLESRNSLIELKKSKDK